MRDTVPDEAQPHILAQDDGLGDPRYSGENNDGDPTDEADTYEGPDMPLPTEAIHHKRRRHPRGKKAILVSSDTVQGEISDYAIKIEGAKNWFLGVDGRDFYESRKTKDGEVFLFPVRDDVLAPTVHALITYDPDDMPAGKRSQYDIEWNRQRHIITHDELKDGTAWELWPGLGIAGTDVHNYVRLVGCIVQNMEVAQHQGSRQSGWRTLASGKHMFVLPSGVCIGAQGELLGERVYLPIYGDAVTPYQQFTHEASATQQSAAIGYYARLNAQGKGLLALSWGLRAMTNSLMHMGGGLIVHGINSSGKSGLVMGLRNLQGHFVGYPLPFSVVNFNSTAARAEDTLSMMRDMIAPIDDLVIKAGDSDAKDASKKADLLEAIYRSFYNDTEVRGRMTAKMERQIARKVEAVPCATAEVIPQVKDSLLNRATLLHLDRQRGDLDIDLMRDEADLHAPGLHALGFGFIRWIAAAMDASREATLAQWRTWRSEETQWLREAVTAHLGKEIPPVAMRLPENAAHILVGTHMLAAYATAQGITIPDVLALVRGALVAVIAEQITYIEQSERQGVDGVTFHEWAMEEIAKALAGGRHHLEARYPLPEGKEWRVPRKLIGHRDRLGAWEELGQLLGYVDPDGEMVYLWPQQIYTLLQEAARHQKRPFYTNKARLFADLREAGILIPSEAGRNTWCARVPTQKEPPRLVHIASAAIWPGIFSDDDEPPAIDPTPTDEAPAPAAPAPREAAPAVQVVLTDTASAPAVASVFVAAPPSADLSDEARADLAIIGDDLWGAVPWVRRAVAHYVDCGSPPFPMPAMKKTAPPVLLQGAALMQRLALYINSHNETQQEHGKDLIRQLGRIASPTSESEARS